MYFKYRFCELFNERKNSEILMHKNFKFLSETGACEDWCTIIDELLNSVGDATPEIKDWK